MTLTTPLRSLLVASLVAVAGTACVSPDGTASDGVPAVAAETTTPAHEAGGTHVGVHGMNLFGSEKLYLSHIPLYSNPHNLQVVVEVKIASGVPDGQAQFGTKNFTVRPSSAFSLGDLANGTLHAVTGTIFLGNFESGGTPAFRNVKFDVQRVIYQHELTPQMPSSAELEYIAVGTPTQPYLVHVIQGPPSFEQVVNVKVPANSLDAASLEAGTLVRIPGQADKVTTRLKPNATVNAIRPGAPSNGGTTTDTNISIDVLGENACLPGTDFFGACPQAQ